MDESISIEKIIETQPLIERKATEEGIKKVTLTKDSGIYFGTGLCSHRQMSCGVPFDILSMILTAASLKKKLGLKDIYHNLADSHALSNNFPFEEVKKTVEHYEKVVTAIVDTLGIENYNIIRASEFQKDDNYIKILENVKNHEQLSKLHSYAQQEIADIEFFRQKGANLKIGWTMSIPDSRYDETFYDKNFKAYMNPNVAFVYVVPGRSFDKKKPRVAPYVDFNPQYRIMLPDNEAAKKIEQAERELGLGLNGAEKYYRGIIELWSEFDPNIQKGSTKERVIYIINRINRLL